MAMPLAGTKPAVFESWQPGLWRWSVPGARRVSAGVTERTGGMESLRARAIFPQGIAMAEQVHGVSIASVERVPAPERPIAGCDALVTQAPGLGLAIRTADCLPLFVWDPAQRVVGIAHAGWRGLAARLPFRLISFLYQRYHTHPDQLWIGIGPAIHACCYEVGAEFDARLGRWIQDRNGGRTCDLIACAVSQLREAGVREGRILDSGQCTACEPDRWFSLRREGAPCGRLVSWVGMT